MYQSTEYSVRMIKLRECFTAIEDKKIVPYYFAFHLHTQLDYILKCKFFSNLFMSLQVLVQSVGLN